MKKLFFLSLLSIFFTSNLTIAPVVYGQLLSCTPTTPASFPCLNPDGSIRPAVTDDGSGTGDGDDGSGTGDGDGGSGTGDGQSASTAKICAQIRQQNGGLDQELENSIVPCGRSAHQCDADASNDQCEFKHLFVLVNNLVRSFIFVVFAPLLTLVLMYIGFLFIKEQAAAKAKAKALLWRVLVGTFFVLASWLIVNLLLTALGADTALTKFFSNN